MTVDRLIRHFKAREYMELCREEDDKCIVRKHAAQRQYRFYSDRGKKTV